MINPFRWVKDRIVDLILGPPDDGSYVSTTTPPPPPCLGYYKGWPIEYIGPAKFPDCRRDSCMNTAPHVPGESCIG